MFDYEPKTDAELRPKCLEPGEYDAEIVSAMAKTSSKGNEMIELQFKVFDDEGKTFLLRDFLMSKMGWKFKACRKQCGILEAYEDQTISPDHFAGKAIRVVTNIEESDEYGSQARIKGYPKVAVSTSPKAAPKRKAVEAGHTDDDAPF